MATENVRLWVFGDCHVGTDLKRGRESLAEALRTSERGGDRGGPPIPWDVAVDIGDMSGGQTPPEDAEGRELVRQFGVLETHRREDVYSVCGNHDRSGLHEEPAWWWRRWVDPTGEHTSCSGVDPARRRYPVSGTWERYTFRVGNLLFLMMSDVNAPGQAVGRGDLGGNPAGAVSADTFSWWCDAVERHPDANVVSVHHYMPKDTTVASGEWEGMVRGDDGHWQSGYHGYKPLGAPKGASYLYFVDGVPDAQAFERHMEAHPGCVALWLGGHTHTHPDDTTGGKSHIESRWGTHFINAAAVSRYHGQRNISMSRHLTFSAGSHKVRVQCYMHMDDYAPQGWYAPAERTLELPIPFEP